MNNLLKISSHARERLEERYNIDIDNDFLAAMNEVTYYKVLSVDIEGVEVRQMEWFGYRIQYAVNWGTVITFLPSNRKATRHGKRYHSLKIKANAYDLITKDKGKTIIDVEKEIDDMQKTIKNLKADIKKINKSHSKAMKNQKEKYSIKIQNILSNSCKT